MSAATDTPSLDPIQDALDTIQALEGGRPTWLVVDHYGIGEEWEGLLRPHADRIFIIDDFSDRNHDCDLLLNQNFNTIGGERYLGLVPTHTQLLLGPRYALLSPQFPELRKARPAKRTDHLTALISFGGSDIDNLTGWVVDALGKPEFDDIAIEVVIGANNPNRFELERQISGRQHSHSYFNPQNMAELMAHSDFAIGAGGSTTWERLCLGLPSIVIAIAQNQVSTCEMLSLHHAINYLGFWPKVEADNLREAIRTTVAALGESCQRPSDQMVDGLGAERVAEILESPWV